MATKATELLIIMQDKVGTLADVTGPIAEAGINLKALCAYAMDGQAILMMVAEDNEGVKSIAQKQGWNVKEKEVVLAGLKDQVGSIKEVADKLKAKGVNLHYCYATTCTDCSSDCACQVVLAGDDADAILAAVS